MSIIKPICIQLAPLLETDVNFKRKENINRMFFTTTCKCSLVNTKNGKIN